MSPGRIAAAVVAAALVALVAMRRGKLGFERTVLAVVAAVALAVVASGILSDLPDPEKAIEDIAEALGQWTYLLVGTMAFLETGAFVGLVAPGEFTVILGGVIAGQGEIELLPLIGIVWGAAILGDSVSFFIGQRLGRSFLERHGSRVRITPERLELVDRYFQRHGGKTILIGRFIGLVRALAPFIAGSSRMAYRNFIPYSMIGTGLWATTFTVLGFVFWRSFSQVTNIAGRATFAFGLVVGTIFLAVYAYRRLRQPEERKRLAEWLERQGRRPLLRPVAAVVRPFVRHVARPLWRVVAPQVRFLVARVTPGNLGIEFTTAVAVAGAGFYVFVLYAVIVSDRPGPTGVDKAASDVTREVRNDTAVDVLKVVTDLASFPVVAALTLLAVLLLGLRRRLAELVTLVVALVIVLVSISLAKAGIDRPRPPGSLVDTKNASYPSGHAAYASVYAALAVTAARVLPGLAARAGFVLAMVLGSASLALTRVYLGAHYFSDVAGGYGLGIAVFAFCAAVTMVITHLRNNGSRAAQAFTAEGDPSP